MQDTETDRSGLRFLEDHPDLVPLVRAALDHYRTWESEPKTQEWQTTYLGFQYHHVSANPQELRQLYSARILRIIHKPSKGAAWYSVRDPAYTLGIIAAVMELKRDRQEAQETPQDFSADFFDVIIGYESAKKLVLRALKARRPVHVLFVGPPASAKTMFLMELARIPGAEYHIGSSTSRAGLASRLIEFKPRIVTIDEMDKMTPDDQNVLLSLCETGLVKETKFQRTRQVELPDTRVFAAANRANFRPEILSRFEILRFSPYTEEEFVNVVVRLLHDREEIPEEIGLKLGETLWTSHQIPNLWKGESVGPDPREAIRIARLMSEPTEEELELVLGLLKEYK